MNSENFTYVQAVYSIGHSFECENGVCDGYPWQLWGIIADYNHIFTILTDVDNANPYIQTMELLPAALVYNDNKSYTIPFDKYSLGLTYQMKSKHYNPKSYARGFQKYVWLALLASTILISSIQFVTTELYKSVMKYKPKMENLSGCCLDIISILSNQGCVISTTITSIRMIQTATFFLGFFLYNTYSNNLLTQLVYVEKEQPFGSLEELLIKRKRYTICTAANHFAYYTFFMDPNNSPFPKPEWASIVNTPRCNDPLTLCSPRFSAFFNTFEFPKSKKIMEPVCAVELMIFTDTPAAFPVSRMNVQLLNNINKTIRKMMESGLRNYLREKFHSNRKYEDDTTKLIPIEYRHIEWVLYAYMFLAVFSIVICLCEHIIKKCLDSCKGKQITELKQDGDSTKQEEKTEVTEGDDKFISALRRHPVYKLRPSSSLFHLHSDDDVLPWDKDFPKQGKTEIIIINY